MPRAFPPDKIQELVNYYQEFGSLTQAANAAQVQIATASRILQRAGIRVLESKLEASRKRSEEDRAAKLSKRYVVPISEQTRQIIDVLKASGSNPNFTEIGKRFGISRQRVWAIYQKHLKPKA